jgi:threonine synthase
MLFYAKKEEAQHNHKYTMQLFSTQHQSPDVTLEEAVMRGLPPDNGLYMPHTINPFPKGFIDSIDKLSIQEIAIQVCESLFAGSIPSDQIKVIVERAINFEAPLVDLGNNHHVLELFHGPSMAFKDFGARFMASLMGYFLEKSQQKIKILVATSGDTGGAVAQGFYNTPNIEVVILYPSGKVSDIQEQQLTTLGGNITALEVNGTFDDCQALVKRAFLDDELRSKFTLASANSINIARLIPQSFYYLSAFAQLKAQGNTEPVVFTVPSGNFGNLSAGLIAHRMGMPVKHFVAATNANKVVPKYLESGTYNPVPSVETISNAMDVGAPSNFVRMKLLAGEQYESVRSLIKGYAYTDTETYAAMKQVYDQTGYLMCPHTAIAYLGSEQYKSDFGPATVVSLSTAHYAKFMPVMEQALGFAPPIPERLESLLGLQKVATDMSTNFDDFKAWLLG